jgi:hypothetical protein
MRSAVGALLAGTAAACAPGEDARLPWWPTTPAVAAPSPLLAALGLAPPRLDGPGCHPGGSAERAGLRGALLRLASGMEVTCVVSPASVPGGGPYAAVTFDGRGRAESASRVSGALAPAEAAAAADGAVRRGLALPGARPIACPMDGWPYAVLRSDGGVPAVRGWRTSDYAALVLAYPAGPDPARGAVVHLRASRRGFPGCRPGGAAAESPGPA